MKKYVDSAYHILQLIMLLAAIGLLGSIIVYNLTGNDPDSHSAFFASFCYVILMATIPVAWAVGRLNITLKFNEELDSKGGKR